jgi:Type III flagellar switch regulator (C-ring) FliN C-term
MASVSGAALSPGSNDLIKSPGANQSPNMEKLNLSSEPAGATSMFLNPLIARLPIGLDSALPIPGFKVRNLIALTTGTVVETAWGHGDDLPLSAGGVQLAWCEFEVMDSRLAVRITRLA